MRTVRRFLGPAVFVFVTSTPAWALAESPNPDDITELEHALDEDLAALDTSDCTAACEALASMRRSADRICELDGGPRCAAARDKVEAARKKVEAACPDCEAAKPSAVPAEPEEVAIHGRSHDGPAPGAPPEAERGGCATCTVGHAPSSSRAAWLFVAFTVAAAVRRRRLGE